MMEYKPAFVGGHPSVQLLLLLVSLLSLVPVLAGSCPSPLCTCSSDLDIICSNKKLDRVPFIQKTSDTNFNSLDLSQNDIKFLPPHAFKHTQVRAIILDGNPLEGISPRAFKGLEHVLEKLHLYDTELFVIHWGVFRKLTALKELHLGRNGMFALPRGLFDGLTNLEDLSLVWNRLASLRKGMFRGLAKLKTLNLMGNQISDIENDAFAKLDALTTLNLNGNQFKVVNAQPFTALFNLKRLYIESNLLTEVPSGVFKSLPELVYISLASNNISQVGDMSFRGSWRLEEVNINSNSLQGVSTDAFSDLERLNKLQLDNNKLAVFGDVNCTLHLSEHLSVFSVRHNEVACDCSLAWIDRLNVRGTKVEGECSKPQNFNGFLLSTLNFTLCRTAENPCESLHENSLN